MRFLSGIIKGIKLVCAALFVLVTVIIFMQVISRYCFNMSFHWVEELAMYSIIWLVFLGSVVATHEKAHTSITFFVDHMPKKVQKYVNALSSALCIVFLIVMMVYSHNTLLVGMRSYSAGLGIPMGFIYLSFPVGGILMCIYFALNIIQEFSTERGEDEE